MDNETVKEMIQKLYTMGNREYFDLYRELAKPPYYCPKERIIGALRFMLLNSDTEKYNVFNRERKGVGFVYIDKEYNIVAHFGGNPGKWIYKKPNSVKSYKFESEETRYKHLKKISDIMSREIILNRILYFAKRIKNENFI
jgi:hypothetical protein